MKPLGVSLVALMLITITAPAEVPGGLRSKQTKERSKDVETTTREGGCELVLTTYTGALAELQGAWWQSVNVQTEQLILLSNHPQVPERVLSLHNSLKAVATQIDRDGDGQFELIVVSSPDRMKLLDVLVMTPNGKLRHSTPEEFTVRLQVYQANQKSLESLDQTIQDAGKDFPKGLRGKE